MDNIRDRYKGSLWADKRKYIHILGLGGIGNMLAVQLAAIGHKLILQDMDMVSTVNIGTQGFKLNQIGKSKVEATTELIKDFFGEPVYLTEERRFSAGDYTYPIVMVCVDSMNTRKDIFDAWIKQPDRELLLEARMSAESFDLYVVTKETEERYKEYLYDESEVMEAPCTYKATRFLASILQGFYVQVLCNYLSEFPLGFKLSYNGPINDIQWI